MLNPKKCNRFKSSVVKVDNNEKNLGKMSKTTATTSTTTTTTARRTSSLFLKENPVKNVWTKITAKMSERRQKTDSKRATMR